ncbi:hypothetical protein BUALT_Bualt06G0138000 [Buddleja alternifolia]|uniref:Uncharacterized protein n=1 Tax=Buddleja alternifolia TaxID=168488 RepID=A0AAV6XLV1_9LAMI|nr:hypothetical protein BUALT_Bualt06G0138000 [Buddleja alternifolia]
MSTSFFSSFEALSTSFGQKVVGLSWAPAPSNANKQEPAVAAVKFDDSKKGKEVNSSYQPTTKKPEDHRRMRALRFAPELDGVYCFETILPY